MSESRRGLGTLRRPVRGSALSCAARQFQSVTHPRFNVNDLRRLPAFVSPPRKRNGLLMGLWVSLAPADVAWGFGVRAECGGGPSIESAWWRETFRTCVKCFRAVLCDICLVWFSLRALVVTMVRLTVRKCVAKMQSKRMSLVRNNFSRDVCGLCGCNWDS